MSDTPPPGHNLPKLPEILTPEVVAALIEAEIAPLKDRAADLVDVCKRFVAAYPQIDSVEADAKATEVLAVVQRFAGAKGRVELARVAFKAPILEADKAIGSFARGPFLKVIAPVIAASMPIERAAIKFKQRIEAEAREVARQEAARRAEEARLAEKMAEAGSERFSFDDAAEAYGKAEEAQAIADSKPAELTRSHGEVGTTSLRYRRIVTIVEAHLVPREYCVPDLSLVTKAAGKPGTPFPNIPGVSIADTPDLNVRK
jgi:hypothetical protein